MKRYEVCLDKFVDGKWLFSKDYEGEQFDFLDNAKEFIKVMQWVLKNDERFIIYDYVKDEFTYAIESKGEIYISEIYKEAK